MTEVILRPLWSPQAGPQHALVHCPLPEIFFGGSRGGGKSDGVLGKMLLKAHRYGGAFNGIVFRRTMPSADDLWERACELWVGAGGAANQTDKSIRLENGARLRLRPLERVDDADKYQGQNLTDAAVDEAGLYPDPRPIDRLHGVLRSAKGVPTQLILTGNPGGAGQTWIKQRYIDPAPKGMQILTRRLSNGMEHRYVFIPSRVTDNKMLLTADPDYVRRLHLVGSEQLVRAWLDGDWGAIEGAFFDCWSTERHVIAPETLPAHWIRFRAMDWGSASPFAVYWVAVASEPWNGLPRGCLVFYREWYGAQVANDARQGLKLTAEEVAAGILSRELPGERIDYSVLDPSAFAQDGGPSLAERMSFAGVQWTKADNRRVRGEGAIGGWDQVRARLKGDADGKPLMVFFSTCKDAIRTLPTLQHDTTRPEDLDTFAEDHAADAIRYACMSRPYAAATPEQRQWQVPKGLGEMTLNEILEADARAAAQRKRI